MLFLFRVAVGAVTVLPLALPAQQADWISANSASAILADAANGKKKDAGLFGSVSLGYLANTGNTDSASLNGKASLGYVAAPWRHAMMFRALKGSTNEVTTAEEYEAAEQSDYIFGDNHYVFGALNYNTNRFSGYDRRLTEVLGYGRRVLSSERHTLDLQIGAGARQTQLTDGGRQREGIVQLAGGYVWNFSKHARFSQRARIEDGSDNTYSESVTAVTANLTGDLALSLSLTVKRNSDVPPGRVNTDTSTLVSVIYGF